MKSNRRAFSKDAILIRDKYLCQYCGSGTTGVDHIVPVSKGGGENKDNKVTCCSVCNSLAGGKLFKDFIEKKLYILKKRLGEPVDYIPFLSMDQAEIIQPVTIDFKIFNHIAGETVRKITRDGAKKFKYHKTCKLFGCNKKISTNRKNRVFCCLEHKYKWHNIQGITNNNLRSLFKRVTRLEESVFGHD